MSYRYTKEIPPELEDLTARQVSMIMRALREGKRVRVRKGEGWIELRPKRPIR